MTKIVDARGLNCPQPVILTKKAMESDGANLTTIVNNKTALENVSKLAQSQGYNFEVEEKASDFHIHMNKDLVNAEEDIKDDRDIAILVKSQYFGEGDKELGEILMKSFLYSLNEIEGQLKHLIFMNSAVFLGIEGSPVIDHLKALEEKGVEILSCGTCLDFYKVKDKLVVGKVTNMYTAMDILTGAAKGITF